MLTGAALLAAAFALWLGATHLRERPWFDRPDLARRRLFDPIVLAAALTSFLAGLILIARASPVAGAAVAGGVALLWGWRRLVRSIAWRRRDLRREIERARAADPGAPPTDLLVRAVLTRHPEWGDELVAQMVLDYPDADRLASVVARMERGFRGFRAGAAARRPGQAPREGAGRSGPAPRS